MRGSEHPRRVALITGGSGAIGGAVAERLAKRGTDVYIGYFSQESKARALAERLQGTPLCLDAADKISIRQAVGTVLATSGRLDILVHSAGITGDRMMSKLTPDDFGQVLDVNVTGAFHLLQAVLPTMRAQGYGRIVHITSYAALHGRTGQTAYAASKAALIGLTKAAALEEIEHGITVNAYAPSVTESAMTDGLTAEARHRLLQAIPLGRMQTPAEAAALIAWLTAAEAGTVSGQVFSGDTRQNGW
ncbi:SDR family NAD(P)-dependent oxidoreductase [Tumebacillus sp. DT12]|uniref:SDR family NAD(P)-dependent oxidoreductase n=1 Tax=Tumebacillus lacus TaxID=2995335 RepID=A0ABT3WXS6_9BACL|nr:SDR family NAD(P)-dependent oxidoreductase [Tumebacillus lacus]MCX7569477.1 SDR family NAD(P)-dependent oxidoreductase [Tumebacillus lacus]